MDPRPRPRQDPAEGPTPRPLAVAPHDRRLDRAAIVVVALVALAVVKPWAGPAQPPPSAAPDAASGPATAAGPRVPVPSGGSGSPAPAPEPGPPAPAFPCYWPTGWRMVVLGRELQWTVRTWIEAAPAASSSPDDPSIPRLALPGPGPMALGFCAPAYGPGAPAWTATRPRIMRAWRLAEGPAGPVWQPVVASMLGNSGAPDLDGVRTRDGGAFAILAGLSPGASGVARRGDARDSPGGPWPAGRYVVVVGPADGAGAAWFGFDVGDPATASR